ncbi:MULTISPECIES: zinc ABC transporter ATP-binding protein AztA [unclassified Curtobacterium]|uniref:zinc ABC transporter ATP-binding protein AztA n=1 Tax=unclassified Curtobacterium TaxID=257496 RepID=UPI0008DE1BFD|nr:MULTISPECIES: zinc ABC transporter ATP-binding protein AztA [unclassified Curtobacterium]OII18151.1 ABC transporter ATP-binding protein [Curtobacterium sp. MCBA15_016]OII18458.1 ABC transporter ATP-binding protein [Curtobacterium sp. MCBA15_013]
MPTTTDAATLDVAGLVVRRGDRTVLDGVDATFPAGSVTALTGPNGSGKSTLLDALAGVVTPDAGAVTRRTSVGVAYVTQSVPPSALPLTVRATVRMGRWSGRPWWRPLVRADRDVVDEQLDRMGIASLSDRPLDELSGGQRQRTLVALGLAQRAGVLLVDEPTAGVDAESGRLVVRALADEAASGVVVVHATHDPTVIAGADRVVRLG